MGWCSDQVPLFSSFFKPEKTGNTGSPLAILGDGVTHFLNLK